MAKESSPLRVVQAAIQSRTFAPVYYLHGDDDYLKDAAVRDLLAAAIDPGTRDFNCEIRRASELDAEAVSSLLSTPPMLAEKRAVVLPVEKTHPLPDLVEQIRNYSKARGDERVMLAYVAIGGFNTGLEDALALKEAFDGIPLTIDLIDVTDPTGKYQPPDADELKAFRDHLQVLKSPIARRYSGGKDIGAACGTLEASQRGGVLMPREPVEIR
jgi:adenine C2-methylase RlmN of 23S rRNA A2503 and tRNA A37